MATKKSKDSCKGFALEVDGEVLGTFKSLEIRDVGGEEVPDFIPSHRPTLPAEVTLAIPEAVRDLWNDVDLFHSSGKCALGRSFPKGPVHPDAELIIKAQLEMWGMDEGEVPVPMECVVKFVQLIEELGYIWWFDSEASPDKEMAEANGVAENFEFNYVSRGEEGK